MRPIILLKNGKIHNKINIKQPSYAIRSSYLVINSTTDLLTDSKNKLIYNAKFEEIPIKFIYTSKTEQKQKPFKPGVLIFQIKINISNPIQNPSCKLNINKQINNIQQKIN